MLDPVDILHIAKLGEMVDVVWLVVIGDEHAALVETLDQHAFSVEIAKAERALHLLHASFPRPVLGGIKERFGDFPVIDEIDL